MVEIITQAGKHAAFPDRFQGNQRPVRHLFITVVKFNFPYPLMGANWRGELFTIKGIFGFDMWVMLPTY